MIHIESTEGRGNMKKCIGGGGHFRGAAGSIQDMSMPNYHWYP